MIPEEITFDKWEHRVLSDEDLKTVAKDIYAGKIFSSAHRVDSSMLDMVFMPLMFMGGENDSLKIEKSDDTIMKRKKKMYNLEMMRARRKYFKKKGLTAEEGRKKWYDEIGLIYEYLDKAGPRCINGCPIFMSCRIMSKSDADRMWKFHDQWKELAEKF
jgi:hypothetical protein